MHGQRLDQGVSGQQSTSTQGICKLCSNINFPPLQIVFGTHFLTKAVVSVSSTRSGMLASAGVGLCAKKIQLHIRECMHIDNGITYFDQGWKNSI